MDATSAHAFSSNHRSQVEASEACGCFYCLSTFAPVEVVEWVDQNSTAICPRCGIDAIIGSASGVPVSAEFLGQMRDRWFGA